MGITETIESALGHGSTEGIVQLPLREKVATLPLLVPLITNDGKLES